jgi:putative membrane protein insertion efficiency factor
MRRREDWRIAERVLAFAVRLVLWDPSGRLENSCPQIERRARYWFLNPLAWLALGIIAAYQRLVPLEIKPRCRFNPSCSVYMSLAIRKYGFWRGRQRGLQRLRRCIGFLPGGDDWP